jgi:hypothetical protein
VSDGAKTKTQKLALDDGQNNTSLLLLICFGSLLQTGSKLPLVHPLDTELVIGLELLHLLRDLHDLNRALLA